MAGGRRAARRSILIFGCALAGLLAAGMLAWRAVPLPVRQEWVPESFQPVEESEDLYLGAFRVENVEHYIFFHGLDPVIDRNLRAADVVLVGNSRLMLGLATEPLRTFFEKHGLRHYMMGFGHGEPVSFTRRVFERVDIHPRWVIANTDAFFLPRLSRYGSEVAHSSRVNGWQVWFETEMTFRILRHLHRWLPFEGVARRKLIVMRSRADGSWFPFFMWGAPEPFRLADPARQSLDPETVRIARAFQDDCGRRGARLVLTFVPTPRGRREEGRLLAEALGVPFVAPAPEGLAVIDTSHLTPASSEVFTREFLRELEPTLSRPGTD